MNSATTGRRDAPPRVSEYNVPLTPANRRFAPALHWTLLALLGIGMFISLGRWQLGRAEEKRILFEGFAAGTAEAVPLPDDYGPLERYRRVTARGRYDSSRQFLLDNMTHEGVAGFHVLTPLVQYDLRVVLVDRGFVPLSGSRTDLPDLSVGDAERAVTGRADSLPRAAVSLAAPPATGWPRWVSFPEMSEIAVTLDARLYPQVVLLDADQPDGYLRNWRPPGMAPDQHIGYAVQWFGLAATVLVTWIVLSFRTRESLP
jgi:surfeit locus 1 family protein